MVKRNYLVTFCFILALFVFFKPFIVRQIIIRGDGYLGFGMYGDAIRQYKKVLLLAPDTIDARNWLAYAYKISGKTREALKTYKDSLSFAPNNVIAYYELGMAKALEKDFKAATPYFLKASSISQGDSRMDEEDYNFYHKSCLKMLDSCRKRLENTERTK